MTKHLSIIIPARNEERRIRDTLLGYGSYFSKRFNTSFEIIVVLNNCNDNTLRVVQECIKKFPQICYLDIPDPIGKGGAIVEGFRIAKGNYLGFVDADLASLPQAFDTLIPFLKDYDCVVASRLVSGAIIKKRQDFSRRLASRVFNTFVRSLFPIKIRDTQCGCKVFRRAAILRVLPELGISRWGFDINLLYLLLRNGFSIKEVPTTWEDIGQSKLRLRRVSLEMFFSTIRLRLLYSPLKFLIYIYDKLPDSLKLHRRLT